MAMRKKRITKVQTTQLEILKDMLVNGTDEEKNAISELLAKREKQAKLEALIKKRDELNELIDEFEKE